MTKYAAFATWLKDNGATWEGIEVRPSAAKAAEAPSEASCSFSPASAAAVNKLSDGSSQQQTSRDLDASEKVPEGSSEEQPSRHSGSVHTPTASSAHDDVTEAHLRSPSAHVHTTEQRRPSLTSDAEFTASRSPGVPGDDQHRGLALFCTEEASCALGQSCEDERVLFSIPSNLVISHQLVLQDPILGHQYQALLQDEASGVDERMLVMLFLLLEMTRGQDSFWALYLNLLPTEFTTPVWLAGADVDGDAGSSWIAGQLEGTPLHKATVSKIRQLQGIFETAVLPAMESLLSTSNRCLELQNVGFKHFLRVYCLFWSRALSLPLPNVEEGSMQVVEALVPGLDFGNHTQQPRARWEVVTRHESADSFAVNLVTGPGVAFGADEEVCFSYGDKGNEELLFLYGFAIEDNPHEFVMVHYPPEVLEDDPSAEVKLQLLGVQDLGLRWLLPRSILVPPSSDRPGLHLPEDVLNALRVLAMDETQIGECISMLEQMRAASDADLTATDAIRVVAASLGPEGETSAVSILKHLLERRLSELQHAELDKNDQSMRPVERRNSTLECYKKACATYRGGQITLLQKLFDAMA